MSLPTYALKNGYQCSPDSDCGTTIPSVPRTGSCCEDDNGGSDVTGKHIGSLLSEEIYAGKENNVLKFKGLLAGTGVSLTDNGKEIIISAEAGSVYKLTYRHTGAAEDTFTFSALIGKTILLVGRYPTIVDHITEGTPNAGQVLIASSTGTVVFGTELNGEQDEGEGEVLVFLYRDALPPAENEDLIPGTVLKDIFTLTIDDTRPYAAGTLIGVILVKPTTDPLNAFTVVGATSGEVIVEESQLLTLDKWYRFPVWWPNDTGEELSFENIVGTVDFKVYLL